MLCRKQGFTLIEVLMVVVLIGITAIAAATMMRSSSNDPAKVATAAQTLATDIAYAQSRAVTTHARVYVIIKKGSGSTADSYSIQSPLGTNVQLPADRGATITFGAGGNLPGARLQASQTIGFDGAGEPFTRTGTTDKPLKYEVFTVKIESASNSGHVSEVRVQPYTGVVTVH